MANPTKIDLEIESTTIHVVYNAKTGAIAHVHRIVMHRGATPVSREEEEARALEMASRFGHSQKNLRVVRAEKFDRSQPLRVDIKTGRIVAVKKTAPQRSVKKPNRKPI